jgi:hypothetical protein
MDKALKYCCMCERVVMPQRHIGTTTFLLMILTCGIWMLVLPFYNKRCPRCLTRKVLRDLSDYEKESMVAVAWGSGRREPQLKKEGL